MPSVSPLTNAGGTIAINLANVYQGECFNCSPYRGFTAGNLVGALPPPPTPTPGLTAAGISTLTLLLILAGLFAAKSGLLRRD